MGDVDYSADLDPIGLCPRTLAFSGKDLADARDEEGAHLSVIDDQRILDLSDDEDPDEGFQDMATLGARHSVEPRLKFEMIRKELITVAMNANKDPKQWEPTLNQAPESFSESVLDLEETYEKLHKRYSPIGKFISLIGDNSTDDNNKYDELSKDVFKKKVCGGLGPAVQDNSFVMFNAALWAEGASEPFDSSWRRRKVFVIDLTNELLIPGLKTVLLSMRQDEMCEAIILDPNLAYGRLGCPPRIPANAPLFCLVEIVKVLHPDKLSKYTIGAGSSQDSTVTFEDFYTAANEARQRGNYYYTRRMFKVALDRYKSGIRILLGFTYKNQSEDDQAKSLLLKLYNNAAKCLNSLKRPRLALSICRMAEDIDKLDAKLNYHYVKAWKIKGDIDMALGRCRYAIQNISDLSARKIFNKLEEELKQELQSEKEELNQLHRLMGQALVSS